MGSAYHLRSESHPGMRIDRHMPVERASHLDPPIHKIVIDHIQKLERTGIGKLLYVSLFNNRVTISAEGLKPHTYLFSDPDLYDKITQLMHQLRKQGKATLSYSKGIGPNA